MLNEINNKRLYNGKSKDGLTSKKVANNGSSQCKRAVGAGYYDNELDKTILCYSGEGMNVYLRTYDHKKKSYEPTECVYENNMYGRWDYHNYANIIKAPDGDKLIFFTKHTKDIYMIKSPNWDRIRVSDDFTCYPSPVVAGNDIYLFYSRHENEINGNIVDGVRMHAYRSLWYMKSTDSGKTWQAPVKIIDTQKKSPLEIDEVYLCDSNYFKATNNHPNRIQLAWTMWGGVNGHASSNEAAYTCYLSLDDGKVYSAAGKLIGDWVDYDGMIEHCLVYKTKEYSPCAMKVASVLSTELKKGNTLVVYGVLDENGLASVRSAELVNGKWDEKIITENTYSVKDVCMDGSTGKVRTVYAKGDMLLVDSYDETDRRWKTIYTVKIEFNNGANSVQYANFVENYKKELQIVLGQSGPEIEQLYKGIWPIMSYGEE